MVIHDLLKDYPIVVEIPIAWGEMDAFGHINNVYYIRYFETGRTKYLSEINFISGTEIGPILSSVSCKYKFPLVYPDSIYIATRVYKMSSDRFWMKYIIVSKKHEKIAAEGEGVIVSYDYQKGSKISFPENVIEKIKHLENNNIELI